jgi:hypothetical protein
MMMTKISPFYCCREKRTCKRLTVRVYRSLHVYWRQARRADAEAVAAAAAGPGHPECAATSEELDARMRAQSPLPREVPLKHRCIHSGAQASRKDYVPGQQAVLEALNPSAAIEHPLLSC